MWSIDDASSINTLLLQVEGTLENSVTKFLLDSGTAVSVVRHDHLSLESCSKIDPDVLPAVRADGNSLDALGQVTQPVSVGEFHTNHKFVVMKNLTVDCLLGADFLTGNKAVLNCHNNHLKIGADNFSTVPFIHTDIKSKAGGNL